MEAENLQKIAKEVRKDIVRMIYQAGSGHPAGSLGMADLFTSLYFGILNHDPKNPNWEERDRLFLSNGHICPALYSVMAKSGYFPESELKNLRKLKSILQGHPERIKLPGIESTSGPLGEGLGQACGHALSGRMDEKHFRVYCITSDGEHNEGSHWESVMFAAKYDLSNLTLFVDRNEIQSDGPTEEIMPINPLKEKYQSFNWNVIEIDGHNFDEINGAVAKARVEYQKPTVIICNVTAGKGVSFMEGDYKWHAKGLTKEELDQALKELK